MSATYDSSLIATSLRDALRGELRDIGGLNGTTVTKPFLEDEEYDGLMERYGEREGAARIAEAIGAVFIQKVTRYAQAGAIDVVWPQRAEFYERKAQTFRIYGVDMGGSGGAYAGAPATPGYCTDPRLVLS